MSMSVSASSSSSRTYFTVGPNAPTVEEFLAGAPATNQHGNMQVQLLHPHPSAQLDDVPAKISFGDIDSKGEFFPYKQPLDYVVVSGTYFGEGSVLAM